VFSGARSCSDALTLIVFAVVLLSSGFVSLGSLTSGAILPVLLGLTVGVRSPVFAISVAVAAFVFWTHRANIARSAAERTSVRKRGVPAKRPAATLAISLVIVLAVFIATRLA
jgi:hypothetical protein